ncbi:6-phosphogluconolactonase [Rhodoblastus acidophilus]|uniref:6-phosphogluconolactonase n=1 Tax=Rhodoblastus acidophilus TaxID=1074 RepID=A0A6N8DMQ5_RHOAC|nr:6-phosphogluconolactonase [Rhodoblastus acidophilus]MTV31759.1 6-phosphogluconolactonase [Rhodoblastus acidophilus]
MPEGAGESGYTLEVLGDAKTVATRAAQWLLSLALGTEGAFALALAGGETPRPLYEQFAAPPFRDEFPWARAHIFWGDERFVAHDDPRSNYRSARETFLARVPIPVQNIHPVDTRAEDAEAAAQAYQRELLAFHGVALLTAARPLFDVTLLGLGEDGHMASLFPGDAALCERQSWTAATKDPTGLARITLTYPAIESSRRVAFLITGAEKSAVLARLLSGDRTLPAAHLRPVGELFLFVDADAAQALG